MSVKWRRGFRFPRILIAVFVLSVLVVSGLAIRSTFAAASSARTIQQPQLPTIDVQMFRTRDSGGHVQVDVSISGAGTILAVTGDVFCTSGCGVQTEPVDFLEVSPGLYRSDCTISSFPTGDNTRGHVTVVTDTGSTTYQWRNTTSGECRPRPDTPTPTNTLVPTITDTPTETETPLSTATDTPTPTETSVGIDTVTVTPTPLETTTGTPSPGTTTPIATPTATPTATVVGQICIGVGPLTGSITSSDPVQVGRLNRDGVSSTCGTPKPTPGILGTSPLHYDAYTVINTTGSAQCFTVNVDAGACTGGNYLFSAAYLGSFDPNNLSQNYLADIGASPNPRGSYSFELPAGTEAVVVVHTVDSSATCPAYGISISTCPCLGTFTDVAPADYFYTPVEYLYCHGAISGYADNTFRPYNNTTRGQLAKIVALAEGWPAYSPQTPTFTDVAPGSAFYTYIETAYQHQVISGYTCGPGCLEFRPNNNITRAQLTKIIVLSEGWPVSPPAQPTFRDVPVGDPFYGYVETAYAHGVISGYSCGAGCLEFRPGNNATRGQISKIVYNAVTSQ